MLKDRQATTWDAAAKALARFPKIRWIWRGAGKRRAVSRASVSELPRGQAYVIREREAAGFALDLGDHPIAVCTEMEAAVAMAGTARPKGRDGPSLAPRRRVSIIDNFEKRRWRISQSTG